MIREGCQPAPRPLHSDDVCKRVKPRARAGQDEPDAGDTDFSRDTHKRMWLAAENDKLHLYRRYEGVTCV